MPNVVAKITPSGTTPEDTPVIIEVSPNAQDEEIVEITVTGLPTDETPEILTPSTSDLLTSKTLPADEPKAVIYDLGPQPTSELPESIKNIVGKIIIVYVNVCIV